MKFRSYLIATALLLTAAVALTQTELTFNQSEQAQESEKTPGRLLANDPIKELEAIFRENFSGEPARALKGTVTIYDDTEEKSRLMETAGFAQQITTSGYLYRIGDLELGKSDSVGILINHAEKTIQLSRFAPTEAAKNYLLDEKLLTDLVNQATVKANVFETKEGRILQLTELAEGPFVSYEIRYQPVTYKIISVSGEMIRLGPLQESSSQLFDLDAAHAEVDGFLYRIEIAYQEVQSQQANHARILDQFVKGWDKQPVLTAAYRDYQLLY